MSRPRRKIVLLLTEGRSDSEALYYELARLFEEHDPDIDVYSVYPKNTGRSNDVTVEQMRSPEEIEGVINHVFIDEFLDKRKLYPKDIARIIQITDLDGAYIPDENIILDEDVRYYDYGIGTTSIDHISLRNKVKRDNLDYLSSISRIRVYQRSGSSAYKLVPYQLFYFSANLDHYLHGDANLALDKKVSMARAFQDKCSEDKNYFTGLFQGSHTRDLSYAGSWDYAREGLNSLQPITNLNVLIDELLVK